MSHDIAHEKNNSKCQIKMIGRCSKLIHNSPSLVSQANYDSEDGTIVLHSHMIWLHPRMTDSQQDWK